jgi:hypothetical protein
MSEWIEWKGGECPVPAGTAVSVRIRLFPAVSTHGDAQTLDWRNDGGLTNIVSYKVEKPTDEPTRAAHDTPGDISMLWEAIDGLKARIAELEGVV